MAGQIGMFESLPATPPNSNEWYTPREIVEAARIVMGGIGLDPMTCEQAQEVVQADRYFTAEQDGLVQPWDCDALWLNPPYSRGIIDASIAKFLWHWERRDIRRSAHVLVNSKTDTGWYHSLLGACTCLCFPKGRLKFWGPNPESDGPRNPQTIFYFARAPFEEGEGRIHWRERQDRVDAVVRFVDQFEVFGFCQRGGWV